MEKIKGIMDKKQNNASNDQEDTDNA